MPTPIFKKKLLALAVVASLSATLMACNGGDDGDDGSKPNADMHFNRVASFAVCSQVGASCESDDSTAAEIVAASSDGMTLIYSNSPKGEIGFVDITNPAAPVAKGHLDMGGEPTSVAVLGGNALVAVNTSANYVNTSGKLAVVDIASQAVVAEIALPGQPDSVAVSKDGKYIAVVIENERDEDFGDGAPPQLPAGSLVIVDVAGAPATWKTRNVALTGLATLYPEDPEPEYVDINEDNLAVVTLQENNHIVLVDLKSGTVTKHFSAGSVDLTQVDLTDKPNLVSQTESQPGRLREPDGVTWISKDQFVTANEGDLDGGSRGYTVFNKDGSVAYEAGNSLEHLMARIGHYNDKRSDAKGNEPENAEYGRFQGTDYLFVASERSSVVAVYDLSAKNMPAFKQVLPAGVGPEGVLAIPSRNLLIAASEEDDRSAHMRSVLNIYQYQTAAPAYPTIQSVNRADGTPIPWAALSGFAAAATGSTVYAVEDSFYKSSRIFTLDTSVKPASLTGELRIRDSNGVLAALAASLPDAKDAAAFDDTDLAAMINADGTVNLDGEGIAVASTGGFWIASEGAGSVAAYESGRAITTANLIVKVSSTGVIESVITLPAEVNALQARFGLEGIAESNGKLVVAFQRAWAGEAQPRIGVYDLAAQTWQFMFYPLDPVTSPYGGWVGLSDITALGNDQFLVVERDGHAGPDARIKRLYRIDLTGKANGATLTKVLVRDLVADLGAPGGLVLEKIEGLAVMANGDVLIVNDNDGVDDHSGETQLINLGKILD